MQHTSGVKPLEVKPAQRPRPRALSRTCDADWVVRDRVDLEEMGANSRRTNEPTVRRRVNALVAYQPLSPHGPRLRSLVRAHTLSSDDVLTLLRALPRPGVPCVVVLDNAGIHTSRQVAAQLATLARRGLRLFSLPAYSPELNEVEPVFGVLKRYHPWKHAPGYPGAVARRCRPQSPG